jgi:hypothetical protein
MLSQLLEGMGYYMKGLKTVLTGLNRLRIESRGRFLETCFHARQRIYLNPLSD